MRPASASSSVFGRYCVFASVIDIFFSVFGQPGINGLAAVSSSQNTQGTAMLHRIIIGPNIRGCIFSVPSIAVNITRDMVS